MQAARQFSFYNRITPNFDHGKVFGRLREIRSDCVRRKRPIDDVDVFERTFEALQLRRSEIQGGELGKQAQRDCSQLELLLDSICMQLPNALDPSVPDATTVVEEFGPAKAPTTKNCHLDLGRQFSIFDFEAGSRVVGNKWVYLKHNGFLLENALVQFGIGKLLEHGFSLVMPPDVVDSALIRACGYLPKGTDNDQTYFISNSSLALSATAEIQLAGMLASRTLPQESLPLRYAAMSHAFRAEIGNYGRESKGLYRLHQFTKLEMFSFCSESQSGPQLEEFVAIQKEIASSLGLSCRLLLMDAGEVGNSAIKKYDIEAWLPMRGSWGEISSASNCSDFQSTRLCTFGKDKHHQKHKIHTVNATAVAVPRLLQAIIENFYDSNCIHIPAALHPFTFGVKKILPNPHSSLQTKD